MVKLLLALRACALLLLCGCASGSAGALQLAALRLPGARGESHTLPSPDARWTVVVFFSADCDCQRAHDARLRELYARYHERGVAWFAVDSEVGASVPRATALAAERAYPFPLLVDRGAKLAHALDAEYATYAVILDATGRVRYRGGLDSDLRDLHADARFYLRDALEAVLAGREPRVAQAQSLGCSLRLW